MKNHILRKVSDLKLPSHPTPPRSLNEQKDQLFHPNSHEPPITLQFLPFLAQTMGEGEMKQVTTTKNFTRASRKTKSRADLEVITASLKTRVQEKGKRKEEDRSEE